jgi:hypothetical protein
LSRLRSERRDEFGFGCGVWVKSLSVEYEDKRYCKY